MLCNWQSATLSRYTQAFVEPIQLGSLKHKQRQGLYLEIRFRDGRLGRGEIAPLPGFSEETLAQAEQQITDYLQGHVQRKLYPSVAFGIDCAMAGLPPTTPIVSGYPLLNGDFAHCQQVLDSQSGNLAKLKVARQSPKQDLELIQQLQRSYPDLQLRLDANRGWIWNQAIFVLENIDLSRIDYIEEPLMNSQQCELLAQRTGVGIGLDETLQDSSYRYHYFEGLRCLVIKPSLLGPWRTCASIIDQAQANQVSCVLSSAYESEFGLQWINAMAKQYTPEQAPGLDTLKTFSEQAAQIELIGEFQHHS
ncbi:o-succinylbenzoate synthase [Agarivorans aestuarii]|uniref:o-succinylbenzoate synthase n=1 Tax=Agarivorans aestuarii TaxID=1563703 RepID=UPI001C81F815|nr:o-succinylbenzoate synthase [Agarivorans aestuarii]